MGKRFILLLFTLLLGNVGFAATYYVDNCINVGSDSYDGKEQTHTIGSSGPWLTLGHVNAQSFSPGDSILFRRTCVWRETLTPPTSGSSGNPITFGGYGSGKRPVLSGANVFAAWTSAGVNLWYTPTATAPMIAMFDRVPGTQRARRGALAANGDWYADSGKQRTYTYRTSNPGRLSNPGVELGQRTVAIDIVQNYITIDGLATELTNGTATGGIILGGSGNNHMTVQNCESRYNTSAGIRVWGTSGGDGLIQNNDVHDNGLGIYGYQHAGATLGHEIVVQHNTVYYNRGVSGVGDGIMVDANYWIVQYNYVHDNGASEVDAIGIHVCGAGPSTDRRYGQHNVIRGNVVTNQRSLPSQDGSGIETDNGTGYNEIYANRLSGNQGPGIDVWESSHNNIHDNTAYANQTGPSFPHPGEIIVGGPGGYSFNNEFTHNTGYATRANYYAVCMDATTAGLGNNSFDSNTWYAPNSANWYYNGSAGGNLATWNALSYVGTDFYARPLLVNLPKTPTGAVK